MNENEILNSLGYDLYEISHDRWAFHIKGGKVFMGSLKEIATYMVSNLGFLLEEIEYAAKEMINQDNNGAHFGMYKSFMFTFQREFKYAANIKKVS